MKHIFWFGILLLAVFSVDRFFSFGMSTLVYNTGFRYSKSYSGEMNNEYLFIGDSRGVTSFYQPEIENLCSKKSYNLSYTGLTAGIAQPILADYFKRNKLPKKVYIEVSFLINVNVNDHLLDNMKIYYPKSEGLRALAKTRISKVYFFQNIFQSYRFNSELFYRALSYIIKDDQSSINRHNIKSALIEKTNAMDSFEFMLEKESLASLIEIITNCETHNVETVLVLGPYYPAYIQKVSNMDIWLNTVEELTGKEVNNFSALITDDQYFADRLHMNYSGGVAIAKYMKDAGLFN